MSPLSAWLLGAWLGPLVALAFLAFGWAVYFVRHRRKADELAVLAAMSVVDWRSSANIRERSKLPIGRFEAAMGRLARADEIQSQWENSELPWVAVHRIAMGGGAQPILGAGNGASVGQGERTVIGALLPDGTIVGGVGFAGGKYGRDVPPVDRNATEFTDPVPHGVDHRTPKPNGQQTAYLVLSEAERAKGFVRPVRRTYVHVGTGLDVLGPGGECIRREPQSPADKRGCGVATTMGEALAETYARDPYFYSGTFCVGCGKHLPLDEFVWAGTAEGVGT